MFYDLFIEFEKVDDSVLGEFKCMMHDFSACMDTLRFFPNSKFPLENM